MEDTALSGEYGCEHGLSLYLETEEERILFDTGKTGLFLENARKLGIDPDQADLAVLSHGHYDHGGGLTAFLSVNRHAPVYLQSLAEERHYARRKSGAVDDIGIPASLKGHPQLVPFTGDRQLSSNLLLFSSVTGQELLSRSNEVLLAREGESFLPDPFLHEQNLLITERGRRILIAGCAHRGIVNILNRAAELAGGPIDIVIGGFHLSNPRDGGCEPPETVRQIARALLSSGAQCYTCHCTGPEAYDMLKTVMGDRLLPLCAGSVITV